MKKITLHITREMVDEFAKFSGDKNLLHLDDSFARRTPFKKRIAHGTILLSKISGIITEELGHGNIILSEEISFLKPVYLEEFIEVKIQKLKKKDKGISELEIVATNSKAETVLRCLAKCMKVYLKDE